MVVIFKTLSPLHTGCFVPSLVEFSPVVLKKILKLGKCISTILLLSTLGKEIVLPLNKLECPSPKYVLCQLSLVEIGSVVLEKKIFFLYFNIRFLLFQNYLPLSFILNKLNPFFQRMLCAKFG